MKALKGIIWLQIVIGFLLVFLPTRMDVPPFVKNPEVGAWMLMFFGIQTLVALHGTLSKKKGG